jgi:hypothetical protein
MMRQYNDQEDRPLRVRTIPRPVVMPQPKDLRAYLCRVPFCPFVIVTLGGLAIRVDEAARCCLSQDGQWVAYFDGGGTGHRLRVMRILRIEAAPRRPSS